MLGDADPAQLEEARALTTAVGHARDWVNRPSADKAPARLAEEMAAVLVGVGYEVEIWDEARIAAERLGGVQAVAAGSDRPPTVLVGRRRSGSQSPHLALVGKGIVFDSGGLSLKTAAAMESMKVDMAGAAAVVGGAEAIGALGLAVDVNVFVPLCDNMPGGSATKPGDVLTARNGKTIEVVNTDCEGRLILADALSLAAESDPDLIVDLATLTGGSRVALGDRIGALFTSGEEVTEMIEAAASRAGERIWPLPLPVDYRQLIDSTVADMKNQGGRSGSAITAALLLAEFTAGLPWAHIDMAAPATFLEDGPDGPKGASGYGVATIVSLAGGLSGQ